MSVKGQDSGDQLGADELRDLVPVGEVPAALVADERQQHAGHVVGGLLESMPGRSVLALEVGDQEAGDEPETRSLSMVSCGRSSSGSVCSTFWRTW